MHDFDSCVLARLSNLPGAMSAGAVSWLPLLSPARRAAKVDPMVTLR